VITRESATPPWRQLARILRERIQSGELPYGSKLPPILRLAEQYGVAPVTARKAITELKRQGWVKTHSGWGTFVADPEIDDEDE
jgi:DNA-binding GntR family transcriptional regulator